ncbi:hypothetical protein ACHAW5_005243 [Stephanodiscus triporus]|uniref:Chitin-binding type-2 domain-containing protein n=1 Tax=Stephanodiscus triporus TaxID=2934178 RepID=A0ABD3MSQ7_9STRA
MWRKMSRPAIPPKRKKTGRTMSSLSRHRLAEEEDWSESSTGISAMSLWCGESQESAYTNCYREGYDCPDGVCFNGLKCFMVGNACEEGEGAGISAQIDISPSPSPATEFEATGNNIGVLGQFCAETFDSLEIVCATATTCVVPEDCPSGTYCWKEFMCGGTVSPSIASAPQSTYSYSPSIFDTSLSSNTLTNSQSANDVAATYPPSPSPTPGSGSSGPQSTVAVQQLFCASTMEELEMSCATAQSCISGPCPSKMFCFPFTCTEAAGDENSPTSTAPSTAPAENQLSQNQLQCPQSTFVGWHTSTDCKEYFKCDNGAMGTVHVCEDSLKFDKVRNQCHPEEQVNSFCYGPPQSTTSSGNLCSEEYTGWESRNGCREYYWCDLGYADVIYDCGQDLLFDITLELCNFASQVVCTENGGASVANKSPSQPPAPSTLTEPPAPKPSTLRPSPVMGTVGGKGSSSGVGGVVGDYNWSDPIASTEPQNTSVETPPWLMNTVKSTNNAKGVMVTENTFPSMMIAFVTFEMIYMFL